MRWSRLWLLLVVLAGAAAAALVTLVPGGGQHALDAEVDARIEAADNAAAQLLQLHARRWLDAAERLADDAALVEAFDQATRGTSDPALLHQTVLERLRAVNARWRASFVIAVDGRGRVLARAGVDEEQWRDELAAFPVVAEALRGYRLDDVWDAGGRLYRVCATPVIAGERYAGALLVADELGADLASRARRALGVDVLFLARGRVVGASPATPPELASAVASLAAARADALSPERHSEPLPLALGGDRFAVVLSPLAGEAGANGALYALVAERPRVGVSPAAILDPGTLARASRPMLAVAGGGALALALGWLLLWLEHGRRVRRLAADVAALDRGEIERVLERRHARALRPIARAANALASRAVTRGAPPPIAGAARAGGVAREVSIAVDGEAEADAATERAADPRRGKRLARRTPARSPQASRRDDGGEAPLSALTVPLSAVTDAAGQGASASGPHPRPGAGAATPTPATTATPTASARAGADDAPPGADATPAPSSGADPLDDPAHLDEYRALHREFLAAKQSCGESTDGVTFDRFLHRLRTSRAQLTARYGCHDVQFHVYVKDGKAALKASPR